MTPPVLEMCTTAPLCCSRMMGSTFCVLGTAPKKLVFKGLQVRELGLVTRRGHHGVALAECKLRKAAAKAGGGACDEPSGLVLRRRGDWSHVESSALQSAPYVDLVVQ
mmetsp:Transcript_4891/g.19582  ORF Transcript_4891/g.19582 Transcript_4891/m.19582 type:complete len:108 (-) Transcript_4891:101-424(-)